MKIIVSVMVLVISGAMASAQPPHGANKEYGKECAEEWCDHAQYPYLFCDGKGKFIQKCSSDPNHEPGLNLGDPPLTMMKKSTPTVFRPCLDLSSSKFGRIIVDPSSPAEWGANTVVFDVLQMDSLATLTEYTWTGLCPPQGPSEEYQYCCMKIRFSTADGDFYPNPPNLIRARTLIAGDGRQSPAHCGISCEGSAIILNQQPAFTGLTDDFVPINFFYTDHRLNVPNGSGPYPFKYYSMYAHLLHEMGHWFGMAHANVPDSLGNVCYHQGSIMEEGSIGDWQSDRQLTKDDKCMFMKAYCCARTTNDVEEGLPDRAKSLAFAIIPNPARTSVKLILAAPMTSHDAIIRVLSLSGEQVAEQSLPKGSTEANIEVGGLTDGVYMAEIAEGSIVTGRKFVIKR